MAQRLRVSSSSYLVRCLLTIAVGVSVGCDDGGKAPGVDAADARAMVDLPDAGVVDAALDQPTSEIAPSDLPPETSDSPVRGDADSHVADGRTDVPEVLPAAPGKLDLVLLVDNSSSMREEQDALRAAFPTFLKSLAGTTGSLPDLHVGVLSSNLGAGPTMVNSACPVGGDRGAFLAKPACGLSLGEGKFMRVNGSDNNVAGGPDQWATAVACLAELGVFGCGYEHQLASLAFGLGESASSGANRGFLREDAVLAVVILSDEDDCSGSVNDADFYEGLVAGQAGSVRCSLRGHVCDGNPVPPMSFEAPLTECSPYQRNDATESKSRLINVSTFVDAVKAAKKGRLDKIFVGSIMGWSDDPAARYRIVLNGGDIDTGMICQHPRTGRAAPGIRLHAFTKAFPNNAVHAICNPDLAAPMADLATKISALLPSP
ncbi:MAG TPA: hypothetical protein VGG33_16220 [Polyangia bacterium]